MLKDLILIENNKKYQFSSKRELVEHLLGNSYFELIEKEKRKLLVFNTVSKCLNTNLKPLKIKKGMEIANINDKFVIFNEETYILSLLSTNKVTLLENKECKLYAKNLNTSNIDGNYIILNRFAKKLLENYINEIHSQIIK